MVDGIDSLLDMMIIIIDGLDCEFSRIENEESHLVEFAVVEKYRFG